MSTDPSYPVKNVFRSIQTFVEVSTLIASSSQSSNVRLRTITFFAFLMFRPQPTILAPLAPRIVLFDPIASIPEHEIVPETRTTAAPVPDAALTSADELVTVVAAADPPPVVPPFCDAHPTRPVAGGVVGFEVGSEPLPTFTSSHCWLYWFFSVSCVIVAPSAVDRSVTVTALPLFWFTSRTRPPSESTSLNFWLAALASVY